MRVATLSSSGRSCVMNRMAKQRSAFSASSCSRISPLHHHVERGGRLVEDEQARLERQRQRQRHPLPHAAGELVRPGVDGVGRNADPAEQLAGAPPRLGATDAAVRGQRVRELLADRQDGVERAHRALEDDGGVAPTPAPQRLSVERGDVGTGHPQLAAHLRVGRQEAQERVADGRLAAAGLAGEAEDLTVEDVEADVIDDGRVAAGMADPQIAHRHQRLGRERRLSGNRHRSGGAARGGAGAGWRPRPARS